MQNYPNISKKNNAFTLVEVLVSMTILAIVMVSILMIYATSSEIALKADLNREMQQNIKSVVETLAEDVRKNGITGLSETNWDAYWTGSSVWSALKIWNDYYFLSNSEKILAANYDTRIDATLCTDIATTCTLVKKWLWPLTNSKMSFTNLEFSMTNWPIPKVTINMSVRAAIKNWVRPDLIRWSVIHFQTTLSERSLQVK